jgi:DNA polymerase-3 subunit epsilon
LDDARSCLHVGIASLKKLGDSVTLKQAFQTQEKNLSWSNYSIFQCRYVYMPKLVQAIEGKKDIDFIYDKGPKKTQTRRATPFGVVRNPDGDYLNAFCKIDNQNKRFYLSTIKELEVVF